MAAGGTKMSFNPYQYTKLSNNDGLPTKPHKDGEISHDMHLKMSKKIAQLTKVIYSLNTKNDDHEAIIQSYKEQYDLRMQQVLNETRAKLDQYHQKYEELQSQQNQVQELQKLVSEYSQHKEEAMEEFASFKQQSQDKIKEINITHEQTVLDLSQELLQAKRDLSEKLQEVDAIQMNLRLDKEQSLQEIRKAHRKEIEDLHKKYETSQNSSLAESEAQYRSDLEALRSQIQQLEEDKVKLGNDYDAKFEKLKGFHETELAALRDSTNSKADEQINHLERKIKDLKLEYSSSQSQNKDLLFQLSEKEQHVSNLQSEVTRLQAVLSDLSSEGSSMSQKMQNAKEEVNKALEKIRELETELTASRDRCDQQAKDLFKKSTEVGQLEATKLQNEVTIQDMHNQLGQLKDKIKWLDSSNENLMQQNQSQEKEVMQQVRTLEKALKDLSKEKNDLVHSHTKEIQKLNEESKQREMELISDNDSKTTRLRHDLEVINERLRQESDEKYENMKKLLEERMEKNSEELKSQNDKLKTELETIQKELEQKLIESQLEVTRLTEMVKDGELGLGSATAHVQALLEKSNQLKNELDTAKNKLEVTSASALKYEKEYLTLKKSHEDYIKEAETNLKIKLEQLSNELDKKWRETLRRECEQLQNELTSQKEEDKRAALAQIMKMKEQELQGERKGWEEKVQELLAEISSLKMKLDDTASKTSDEISTLKSQAEVEKQQLMDELLKSANQYAEKIAAMEKLHEEKLQTFDENKNKEMKVMEDTMRSRQIEDMKAQMTANKVMLESVRSQADEKLKNELETLEKQHNKQIETLKMKMQLEHSEEMEDADKNHRLQLQAAYMELERAMEISRQQEGNYAMQISDLNDEIRSKEGQIKATEKEISEIQRNLDTITKEFQVKVKEVQIVKNDAEESLRNQERDLRSYFEEKLSEEQADHIKEKQEMLGDFNAAQDLMKEKINTLKTMLEEAEERYLNRESRPEDIELIERLRHELEKREDALNRLLNEKKFYQMELVNREQNFNKVFSASPNVGVLNPLQPPKKPKAGQPIRRASRPGVAALGGFDAMGPHSFGSQGSISSIGSVSRLDPLPGSPLHDESINHNRPLPPTTKKFLK